MHCKTFQENLFDIAGKKLPASFQQECETHAKGCNHCSKLLIEFQSVNSIIEKRVSVEPRPFAATRILQRVESELENRQNAMVFPFQKILQPVFISLSILIALSAGILLGLKGESRYTSQILNDQEIDSVRMELNIPGFMSDELDLPN